MTIKEHRAFFHLHLSALYEAEEIDSFFFLSVEKYLTFNKAETILSLDRNISASISDQLKSVCSRLEQSEPIQYILGETEFYGLPIVVNSTTLIPRPETEELVEWILKDGKLNALSEATVLDIGTGSGCIAIAIAKYWEKALVWAWDISQDALEIAQKNAVKNKVNVAFQQIDVLNSPHIDRKFNIIVSNPPYVRESERKEMQSNVLHFEPDSALFVSDHDPFLFYRKIAVLGRSCLESNGFLYFEINEYLGVQLIQLLEEEGYTDILLKKDYFGKDRMIRCSLYEKA